MILMEGSYLVFWRNCFASPRPTHGNSIDTSAHFGGELHIGFAEQVPVNAVQVIARIAFAAQNDLRCRVVQ